MAAGSAAAVALPKADRIVCVGAGDDGARGLAMMARARFAELGEDHVRCVVGTYS